MSWGQLLQIELRACVEDRLDDDHWVQRKMLLVVEAAGMKVTVLPEPTRESGPDPKVQAICLLKKGHCAVHTFPEKRACFITLLTVGEFSAPNAIAEVAAGTFGAGKTDYTLLPVGEWWDGTEGRMPPIEPFVLVDLLSLASVTVSEDVVEEWTQDEMEKAAEWASAVHADAGDSDGVVVPPKPAFLPEADHYIPTTPYPKHESDPHA
ncbi:hypothetical protein LCGC14_0813580 [marine sediment metagenome]|uniref:Uncharacterized protein n=1 Tax=marine sediment metagenome TaxID=412755 RepID=A0A0F9S5T6_9ZZZZ